MQDIKNIKVSYKAIASALCVLMPLSFSVYSYAAYAQEKSGSIKIIDMSNKGNKESPQASQPTAQPAPAPVQQTPAPKSSTIRIIKNNTPPSAATAPQQASSPVSTTGSLSVRAATHDRYDRLVFDWPSNVNYTPKKEGNVFTITFDKPGDADIQGLAKTMPLIASVQSKQTSPFSITLVMKDKVVPDTFRVGNRVVVDFKKDLAIPEFAKPTDRKFETDVQNTAEQTKKPEAKTAPVEQASTAPKLDVAVPALAENPNMPDASSLVNTAPVTAKSSARFKALEKAEKEFTDKTVRLVSGDVISVSSLNPLNLAVFVRGGYLWIAQSELRQGIPPVLRQTKQIEAKSIRDKNAKTEAWLFPITEGLQPSVKMTDFSWEITIGKEIMDTRSVPVLTEKTKYQEKVQDVVRVKLNDTTVPLRFADPFIGDELVVVPVSQNGIRVYKAGSSPKFDFIPASVGVAIDPISDGLDVFVEENDVLIADAEGLSLSVPDQTPRQNVAEEKKKNRIFDMDKWKITSTNEFEKNKHALEVATSKIEDEQERIPKLLELAKLYFANGFAHEALGYLRTIEQMGDSIKNNPSFIAFKGICYSLANLHEDALKTFQNPLIANESEIALWRGYSLANLGEWKKAYDNFSGTGSMIVDYPEPIRSKMLVVLAEAAANVYDAVNAQTLVNLLEQKEDKTEREDSAVRYLKARLAILNRDNETAQKLLEAETKSPDRYYRAKAALELLKLRMREGNMENKDAAEVLERLRYVWRDDGFEIEVLEMLGQTYIAMDDYRRGLTRLRGIVPLVENDQEKTEEITKKLTGYFNKLFVEGDAANMPPLTALALYNEFSELTPVGKEGDVAIQKLAERMVEIDLLDRAAKLLEHQIKFRLTGVEAITVGNRLAAILLLDNNPEKAIEVLDQAKPEEVPAEFDEERKLLRARAYSQMNQPDKAIEILSGLNSEMAHRLNVDVNWKAGRWELAAKAMDPLLGFVLKENDLLDANGKVKSLNQDAADLVLNQAVAYTLAGQLTQVRALADAYGETIAKTKNAALFQLITRSPKPGQLADLATLQSHVGEVDLFKGFLDAYKTQDATTEANATTPAATPAAPAANAPAATPPAAAPATNTPAAPAETSEENEDL